MPRPQILPTHTPALFTQAVAQAAAELRQGGVVALPTETVYGLAANAFEAREVEQIFTIKGRPSHNPIIVHVADIEMARRCVSKWPVVADKLAAAFWPGPLTMVLPRSVEIPDVVTAGGTTVGVRWPSHPIMQAVIRSCGFPLAAPSANLSNEISPTNAEHVARGLGERIGLIVDGGHAQVGIESTVIDLTVSPPRLLRPGMIHEESILAVTGVLAGTMCNSIGPLKSPGQLQKHYAPRAQLVMKSWRDEQDFSAQLAQLQRHLPAPVAAKQIFVIAHTHIPLQATVGNISVIPHDAEAFARAIYAELHRCDEEGAQLILVEALPTGPEWRAIADRLQRAAA